MSVRGRAAFRVLWALVGVVLSIPAFVVLLSLGAFFVVVTGEPWFGAGSLQGLSDRTTQSALVAVGVRALSVAVMVYWLGVLFLIGQLAAGARLSRPWLAYCVAMLVTAPVWLTGVPLIGNAAVPHVLFMASLVIAAARQAKRSAQGT